MAEERPADDPRLTAAARHALHDEELVAAFAAGDAEADESPRATALIERCPTCAELARDVAAIVGATRSLDAADAAAAYVKAPRDFRLSPEDVGLARPAVLVRPARPAGRIAALVGGLSSFARPVGATLATFGLVGLLVGTVSLGPLAAGPAAAPGDAAATAAPGVAQPPGGAGQAPGATDDGRTEVQVQPGASTRQQTDLGFGTTSEGGAEPSTSAWLFAGSLVLVVVGAALLWGGSKGRRGATGPEDRS